MIGAILLAGSLFGGFVNLPDGSLVRKCLEWR